MGRFFERFWTTLPFGFGISVGLAICDVTWARWEWWAATALIVGGWAVMNWFSQPPNPRRNDT